MDLRLTATLSGVKLLLGAAVCAALVGGGLCAAAAPASACPNGTVQTHFDGVCVSGQAGGGQVVNGQLSGSVVPDGGGPVMGAAPNQLPTVNGIPCTPAKYGTCIGLIQSQS